jgi:RHS repeat-associated protein
VNKTDYTRYGELARTHLGAAGKRVWQSYYYETNTRRLERTIVDAEVPRPMQSDIHYTYDPSGNVTSVADTPAESTADVQCFRYDHLRRLTEAWTPEADCGADPSTSGLAGAAPYWQSFTYDPAGNRLTETQHAAAGDTVRTYAYPAAGAHALRSVTTARPAGTTTDEFTYDATGNAITRPGQKLDWDAEGKLTKVTEGGKTTEYVYDADGDRLIRRDPTGRTLYLDGQELRLDSASGRLLGSRFYQHAGTTVAVRTGAGLTWLGSDHQGTALVAIDDATQRVTKRRQAPFGATRGTASTFPSEKGFVGGTVDASTGLVHLGAREYDPAVGRFLSVDPVLDVADPQQLHGYAYANNNPVTRSDPTGLYAPSCNKFGDCMVGKRPPGSPAPQPPPPAPPKASRNKPGVQPSCNEQGDCRRGVRGPTPKPGLSCDKGGDCRIGVKGPSIEELARRAERVSWEENRKVGAPLEPECDFWCDLKKVTDSPVFKWAGVVLGAVALVACTICAIAGAVSLAMTAVATTSNCVAAGRGTGSGTDCLTSAISLGLGGAGAGAAALGGRMLRTGSALANNGNRINGAVLKGASYIPRAAALEAQVSGLGLDTVDASGAIPPGPPASSCEVNLRC